MSSVHVAISPDDVRTTGIPSGLPTWLESVAEAVSRAFVQGKAVSVEPDLKMMTTSQFAARFGCSRSTVSRLIKLGAIHAEMVGSHHRISEVEFERYCDVRARAMMTLVADDLDAELFGDE